MTGSPDAAFFLPRLSLGGAQRVTLNITAGLANRGYDVDLVLAYPDGELRAEVDGAVRLVDLEAPWLPGIGLAASIPHVRSYLRRAHPDVFVSALTFANVVTLLSVLDGVNDTDLVVAEHDTFGMADGAKNRLTRGLATVLYPRADYVLAVSAGAAESVSSKTLIDDSSVSVLHNPIEVDEVREAATEPVDHQWLTDEDYTVVVGVGRMTPQKDFETLVRAFDRLREDSGRDDLRLVVAGKGERLDELRSLVERLDLRDVVDLPGYVDDVYGYVARADVFALSSAWEGLPTVLIEALACGTPVVATDCPSGPREILRDGDLGPLVPVGDPDAMANAIAESLGDPPATDELRDRADDFSPEAVVDDYAALVDGRL